MLALLYLTLHDDVRAWKGFGWDAMDRLHRKGLIHDPVGKAKSVVLTSRRASGCSQSCSRSPRRRISLHSQPPGQGDDRATVAAACRALTFQGRSSSRRVMGWPRAIRSRTSAR
jgi:hypothetical protein